MSWHSPSTGVGTGAPLADGVLILVACAALVAVGAAAVLLTTLLVL